MCTVPAVYGQRESAPRSSDLRKLTERGGLRGSVHADDHVMQLHRSAVRMHSAGLFVRGIDQPARRIEQTRRSEEHTSELQSRGHLVCRLLLEKKKRNS